MVGTIRIAIWLPLRVSRSFSVCVSDAMSPLDSVPVWSTTRPVSGGTATKASAGATQPSSSARDENPCSVHRGMPLAAYFAGAGVGLKSTLGAVEISFSFSTEKFGFSL